MTVNPFLTNKSLSDLINRVKIDEGKKKILLLRVLQMDEQERIELLEALTDVYLLELEEEEVVERLNDYFSKRKVEA